MTSIILWSCVVFLVLFAVYICYSFVPWKRPWPTESDWSNHVPVYWQLYYSSKYLNPVRKSARGSNLEAFFRTIKKPEFSGELRERRIVTLLAAGDLMCRRDLVPPQSPHLWDECGPFIFNADICMGNLEFSVNPNWIIRKIVRYSVPASYALPLLADSRFGRFHYVSAANNHINDSLSQGIASTLDFLDSAGVSHSGAYRDPAEQDAIPILERNGVKIAFLAYTFSTNGLPLENASVNGANLIRFNALDNNDYDPSLIHRHIALARHRGADLIVSSLHWGLEFEYYPPVRIVQRAHALMDAGIDIILGHHPHILNPAEWYTTRDGRTALCCYSLSNLTSFALIRPMQRLAETVRITVETGLDEQGRRAVRLSDATFTPTWFRIHGRGKRSDNRVVPLLSTTQKIRAGNAPAWLSRRERSRLIWLEKEYRRYFMQDAFGYR